MIKEIAKNPEAVFEITVHNEPVAELRSARSMVAPGDAVRKLIRLRQKMSHLCDTEAKEPISKRVKKYLHIQDNK